MRLTWIPLIHEAWARWLAWPTIWAFTMITWYLLPNDPVHGFSWFAATHQPDRYALMFFLFTNIALSFFVRWEDAPNIVYFQQEKTREAWLDASSAYSFSVLIVAMIIYFIPSIQGWMIPNVALFSLLVMTFFFKTLWKIMDHLMDRLPSPENSFLQNRYGMVDKTKNNGYNIQVQFKKDNRS